MTYLNEDPEKPLVIEIIMPLNGTLRVNPMFRSAIHEANQEKRMIGKTIWNGRHSLSNAFNSATIQLPGLCNGLLHCNGISFAMVKSI